MGYDVEVKRSELESLSRRVDALERQRPEDRIAHERKIWDLDHRISDVRGKWFDLDMKVTSIFLGLLLAVFMGFIAVLLISARLPPRDTDGAIAELEVEHQRWDGAVAGGG